MENMDSTKVSAVSTSAPEEKHHVRRQFEFLHNKAGDPEFTRQGISE